MKEIKNNIYYVGVNDYDIDLFEARYPVEKGMAYNSYVILDEKITIIDSVDVHFKDEWLDSISKVLKDGVPTYLVVQHVEPDHSGSILAFLQKYPSVTVVGNKKTFQFLSQFYGDIKNIYTVNDGDSLNLGTHNLKFIFAPMVHWPEVMFTYEEVDKILFSADAFGKFGALDVDEDWACEARRYYFGIVGKYGLPVQTVLKKLSSFTIDMICPLHGPILDDNLSYYLNLYNIWSSYQNEADGVAVFYTSVYGNTKKAVDIIVDKLQDKGIKVVCFDLVRCDITEAIEDAFKYSKVIFATTTYNNDLFPNMNEFLNQLVERNFQNKKVGIVENGTWAPACDRRIRERLATSKNISFTSSVKILSALKESNLEEINKLVEDLIN